MKEKKKILMVNFFLICLVLVYPINATVLSDALLSFEKGDVEKSQNLFIKYEQMAKEIKDPYAKFDAHIVLSWFNRQIANMNMAISHAFKAQYYSEQTKSLRMKARANSYLGWNFLSVGAYEASEKLLIKAIEQSAPGFLKLEKETVQGIRQESQIQYPMIWGLSTQELGNLYYKTGKVDLGLSLLNTTFSYAMRNRIDVGISESAAHIVFIEVEKDNLGRAAKLASRSYQAAKKCDCSKLNIARALYAIALVKVKDYERNKAGKGIQEAIERSQEYSKENGIDFYYAKSLLLASSYDKDSTPFEREERIDMALGILEMMSSPELSVAYLEKSKIRVEDRDLQFAHILLKKGINLAKKKGNIFHQSHLSYQMVEFLDQFKKGYKLKIKNLLKQQAFNWKKKLYQQHLKVSLELAKDFKEKNLFKMQINCYKEAIKSASIIYQRERNEQLKKTKHQELTMIKSSLASLLGSFYRDDSRQLGPNNVFLRQNL